MNCPISKLFFAKDENKEKSLYIVFKNSNSIYLKKPNMKEANIFYNKNEKNNEIAEVAGNGHLLVPVEKQGNIKEEGIIEIDENGEIKNLFTFEAEKEVK